MPKKDYDKTLRRLTQILSKLSYDERPNTKELAQEFNVNRRTIQIDIKDRLCDFPIIRDSQNRLIFQEGFSLSRTFLDTDEMMFLKIALSQYDDVKDIDKIKERIFKKLETKNFYNPYYIKQDDMEDLDIDSPFIERLEKYIKNQEILTLKLQHKSVDVEAYKIANFDGFWYFFAKDLSDGRVKTFRLSEILDVQVTGRYYTVTPQEIENILGKAHSAFYCDGNSFKVVIKVTKAVALYFKNKDFLESQRVEEEYEDGSLKVSFEVSSDEDIDNIIKSWLPDIEVLEPKRYKDKIVQELQNYLKKIN